MSDDLHKRIMDEAQEAYSQAARREAIVSSRDSINALYESGEVHPDVILVRSLAGAHEVILDALAGLPHEANSPDLRQQAIASEIVLAAMISGVVTDHVAALDIDSPEECAVAIVRLVGPHYASEVLGFDVLIVKDEDDDDD